MPSNLDENNNCYYVEAFLPPPVLQASGGLIVMELFVRTQSDPGTRSYAPEVSRAEVAAVS